MDGPPEIRRRSTAPRKTCPPARPLALAFLVQPLTSMRAPILCGAFLVTACATSSLLAQTLPLRIERGGQTIAATCSLIQRSDTTPTTTLTFATAGHLFRTIDGDRLADIGAVSVLGLAGPSPVAVREVILPPAVVVDIALLRVAVHAVDLAPLPLVFVPPGPGTEFRVAGFDHAGMPVQSVQRVRIRTSSLLLGDREASSLAGCEGAPAISDQGQFGVVVSCERGKVVIVSLLQLSEAFLRHHVPLPPRTALPTPANPALPPPRATGGAHTSGRP